MLNYTNVFYAVKMNTFLSRLNPLVQKLRYKATVLFSDKYLLFTNTAISVSLSVTGDIIQQNYQMLQKNMKSWNRTRMLHVAFSGLVIGPFCHYWYIYLDKWFPGRTFGIIVRKLLLDQIICSPIYIGLFFASIGILERRAWKDIAAESIDKGSIIYTMEWLVWPPAQIVNFCFISTRFRVLYDNVIGLGFDAYFSNIKYHSSEPDVDFSSVIDDCNDDIQEENRCCNYEEDDDPKTVQYDTIIAC